MAIEFNHTLVHASDDKQSATFLATILGLPGPREWGPFKIVTTSNSVNVDFMQTDDEFAPQHYAFLVSEGEFDDILGRIKDRGLTWWADPRREKDSEINHNDGGRGVYFQDPDGHMMEILTRPYGSGGTVKIDEDIVLQAPPSQVWERIGSFGAIGDWHPMLRIVESEGNHVGARRTATGEDGGTQVEKLVSYKDTARPHRKICYGYTMEETAMPVTAYEAVFAVEAEGDGSRIRWTAFFEDQDSDGAGEDMVRGFIEAGLQALPGYLTKEGLRTDGG